MNSFFNSAPENRLSVKGIFLEGIHRFGERLGQGLARLSRRAPFVGEFVKISGLRHAGVESLADALGGLAASISAPAR